MSEVKFTWDLTEKEYKRLKKDLSAKKYISDNCYGVLIAGRLFIDILTMRYGDLVGDDEAGKRADENILDTNVFLVGDKNDIYDYFDNGVPYSLIRDTIDTKNINVNGSFDEFKASFEAEVLRVAKEEIPEWNGYLAFDECTDMIKEFVITNETA